MTRRKRRTTGKTLWKKTDRTLSWESIERSKSAGIWSALERAITQDELDYVCYTMDRSMPLEGYHISSRNEVAAKSLRQSSLWPWFPGFRPLFRLGHIDLRWCLRISITELHNHNAPPRYYMDIVSWCSIKHLEGITHSGITLIALPPNRLWQTLHTRSSVITTLRFLPALPPGLPSPKCSLASSAMSTVLRRPATTLASFTIVFADRILAWKYDSSFCTGRTSGIRSRVEEAGNREPCLARMSKAGPHWGSLGGGGDKYRERSE